MGVRVLALDGAVPRRRPVVRGRSASPPPRMESEGVLAFALLRATSVGVGRGVGAGRTGVGVGVALATTTGVACARGVGVTAGAGGRLAASDFAAVSSLSKMSTKGVSFIV